MKYLIKSFSDKVSAVIIFLLLFEIAVGLGLAINCMYDYGFYTPNAAQYAFQEVMKSKTAGEFDNLSDYYFLYLKQQEGTASATDLIKLESYSQAYSREKSNLLVIVSSRESPHVLCTFEDEKLDLSRDTCYQRYAEAEAYHGNRDVKISVNIKLYVRKDMGASDSYKVVAKLVSIALSLKYAVIALFMLMTLAPLVVLGLLMSSMSVRDENESVQIRFIDRVPIDVLGIVMGIIFAFVTSLVVLTAVADVKEESLVLWNSIMLVLGLVVAMLILTVNLTAATRIKRGHIFRSTVVYMLIVRIRRLLGKGQDGGFKVPYVGKIVLTIALFVLADLGFLSYFIYQYAAIETNSLLEFNFLYYAVIHIVGVFMLIPVLLMVISNLNYIRQSGERLAEGDLKYSIDPKIMFGDFKTIGRNLSEIQLEMLRFIEENTKSRETRSELITNISHDIKTPLTSIINYTNLLRREIGDPARTEEYLQILENQSMKLDRLLQSLIEISKVSSGDIAVSVEPLDLGLFLSQTADAFDMRLREKNLTLALSPLPDETCIPADGELLWRVFENLMNNICKYSLESTRVYIDAAASGGRVSISFKNISKAPLNLSGEELVRRFKRGDGSRHTEGYGLGLSIAKNLTELQGGTFDIYVDGDLFKVTLTFEKII